MKKYIIYCPSGYDYEVDTKKEAFKKVEELKNRRVEYLKEQLEEEEKDLEYFYKGQYDKMSILDRPYFLERGEEGLKELEKQTKENIEDFKYEIEELESNTLKYTIYEKIEEV